MARIVLRGGPTPGPMTVPADLPPPFIDSVTERGVHRYARTEEVDERTGRIVYVTGEMVLTWADPDMERL